MTVETRTSFVNNILTYVLYKYLIIMKINIFAVTKIFYCKQESTYLYTPPTPISYCLSNIKQYYLRSHKIFLIC